MRLDKDGMHTLEEDIQRIWAGHGLEVIKEKVHAGEKEGTTIWEIHAKRNEMLLRKDRMKEITSMDKDALRKICLMKDSGLSNSVKNNYRSKIQERG